MAAARPGALKRTPPPPPSPPPPPPGAARRPSRRLPPPRRADRGAAAGWAAVPRVWGAPVATRRAPRAWCRGSWQGRSCREAFAPDCLAVTQLQRARQTLPLNRKRARDPPAQCECGAAQAVLKQQRRCWAACPRGSYRAAYCAARTPASRACCAAGGRRAAARGAAGAPPRCAAWRARAPRFRWGPRPLGWISCEGRPGGAAAAQRRPGRGARATAPHPAWQAARALWPRARARARGGGRTAPRRPPPLQPPAVSARLAPPTRSTPAARAAGGAAAGPGAAAGGRQAAAGGGRQGRALGRRELRARRPRQGADRHQPPARCARAQGRRPWAARQRPHAVWLPRACAARRPRFRGSGAPPSSTTPPRSCLPP
jgi:hypothetical protein